MTRDKRLQENIMDHLRSNAGLYFLVMVFFAAGVAGGAFTLKALDDTEKQALIKYLQGFFQILGSQKINSGAVFAQSLKNNIQTAVVIWILGITIIGIPLTLIIIGLRGFIIGFTVGFLINSLGTKGLFFSILVILPQNIIIIPCLIAIGVLSISFSLMITRDRMAKRWTKNYWQKFLSYSILIALLLMVSICGSLVEAYVTPVFINLMSSYLNS